MSGFWRGWFAVWCVSIAVFGAVLAGGAFETTSGPVRLLLSILHGGGDPRFDPALRFSLAVMGAVSIGWAVTLFFLLRAAIELAGQGRALWNAVTTGIVVWFVVDSILSVATGYARNVAPNIGLTAMYFVGLVGSGALKRQT